MSLIPIPGNTQDQYEELADHLANSAYTKVNDNLYYIASHYIATVYVVNVSPTTTTATVGTIPSAIRPKAEMRFTGMCGAYGANNMQVKVKTTGEVTVESDASRTSGYCVCTYAI